MKFKISLLTLSTFLLSGCLNMYGNNAPVYSGYPQQGGSFSNVPVDYGYQPQPAYNQYQYNNPPPIDQNIERAKQQAQEAYEKQQKALQAQQKKAEQQALAQQKRIEEARKQTIEAQKQAQQKVQNVQSDTQQSIESYYEKAQQEAELARKKANEEAQKLNQKVTGEVEKTKQTAQNITQPANNPPPKSASETTKPKVEEKPREVVRPSNPEKETKSTKNEQVASKSDSGKSSKSEGGAVSSLLKKASDAIGRGDLESAAGHLESAQRLDPSNSKILYDIANVRYHQGRYKEAENFASRAVKTAGNNATKKKSWSLIANARKALGDNQGAITAAEKASSL